MKNIYNIFALVFIIVLAFSCQNDDGVFDQSASERKTEAVEEYNNSLLSSENGWVLEYFVDDDFAFGGYTYIVKFGEKNNANVWFDMMANVNTPLSSMYDVKNYGGPVLSFDTYNVFMHYFANPNVSEYNAKGGDFEFLIQNENGDTINVQGLKYNKKMRLIKLKETPSSYIKKVQENTTLMTNASFVARQDGAEIGLKASSRRFTFTFTENDEEKSLTVQYIITLTGIRLYEDTEINGKMYLNFTFDDNKENLVSSDGSLKLQVIIPPIDLNQAGWLLNINGANSRSNKVLNSFIEIYNANLNIYGEQRLNPNVLVGAIELNNGSVLYGITLQSTPYLANCNLSFEGVAENSEYLNIVKGEGGMNWQFYRHLEPFVDLLTKASPYKLEYDNSDDPTSIKLISVNDPDVWFVVNK